MNIQDTYIYLSTDVARYLVALANEKKIVMNMTKLQKLLYIVYGAYLGINGERLLDEHPRAWPYGPVFPIARKKFLDVEFLSISKDEVPDTVQQDTFLHNLIDFVLKNFGPWSAGQLSNWSHEKNAPWDRTREAKNFEFGDVISDQLIYDYFRTIIKFKPAS